MKRSIKIIGIAFVALALLVGAWGPAFVPHALAQTTGGTSTSGSGVVGAGTGGTANVAPGGGPKFSLLSCGFNLATCMVYVVGLVAATLSAALVGMGAYLAGLALKINVLLMKTPAILAGFGISLAIANLGFVLGIIVIAIATMLRIQSYGMKQLLAKLVFMAILVNFSMVIAGSIIGFSDGLSNYFLNAVSPAQGQGLASWKQGGSVWGYVDYMTSSFGPQKLFLGDQSVAATIISSFNPGSAMSQYLKSLANLFFIFIFTLIVVIAFFALSIMLFIRYAYLVILLVLMPLAWLAWVFPNLSKHFTNWWDKFLHWTFFPPLVLFFLYLAFLTIQKSFTGSFVQLVQNDLVISNTSGVGKMLQDFIVFGVQDFLGAVTGMMIAGTLVFGGFFAANKFGIVGASAAMASVKGVSKNAGKYVWSKGSGAAARYFSAPTSSGKVGPALQALLAPRAVTKPLQDAERARITAQEFRDKMKAAGPDVDGREFEHWKSEAEKSEAQEKKFRESAAQARARILRGEKVPIEEEGGAERAPIWRAQGMMQRAEGAREALSRTLLIHAAKMETTPGLAKSLWQGATGGLFKKHKEFTKKELEELGIHMKHEEGGEHSPGGGGGAAPTPKLGGAGSDHH